MASRLIAFALLMVSLLMSHEARSSDWGCEVLLCAASSDPSWHSVSECHPPMEKLISAMKSPGFAWPTCPEGGSGKPGYEAYADCPVGTSPAALPDIGDNHGADSAKSQCMRTVTSCRGSSLVQDSDGKRRASAGDGTTRVYRKGNSCIFDEYSVRPRRRQPYYFYILDEETKTSKRHFFDLDR